MIATLLLFLAPASPVLGALLPENRPGNLPRQVSEADAEDLRRLRTWVQRARRSREGLELEDRVVVEALVLQLEGARKELPDLGRDLDLTLLDLASLHRVTPNRKTPEGLRATHALALVGDRALERRLRSDPHGFGAFLANQVLSDSEVNEDRRVAGAELLEGQHLRPTRSALLRVARGEASDLRDAALAALVGWPDPFVTQFFLDRVDEEGRGFALLGEHLETAHESLRELELERVRELCGRLYLSADWRDAARARTLVRVLDTHRAVPLLMEALVAWSRRTEAGEGSRRIQGEIVRELQRVSGRSLGLVPERWVRWWNAVLEGRVSLPEEVEETGAFISSASFFGLDVLTDRVTLVIDHSGSMQGTIGSDGRTRYAEAIDQFLRFLGQMGSETRFSLVLFDDRGTRWQNRLVPATEKNLEHARRWLARQEPEGSTQLFEGLREALRLDRQGRMDPDRVDADTVIVLCDGATAQGPDWVRPWMQRENEVAQLVFHCVQIGRSGKGTLEALAAASGGDFVRVD